jgi:hypothetical protein
MDICMDGPLLNLEKPKPFAEPVMIGLAAVGLGILLGIWVAGPALTGTGTVVASDPITRSIPMSYNDMMARPDPFAYRSATPSFDTGGRIDYAAAAKARAQAETTGQASTRDNAADPWDRQTGRSASRNYDRHSIH